MSREQIIVNTSKIEMLPALVMLYIVCTFECQAISSVTARVITIRKASFHRRGHMPLTVHIQYSQFKMLSSLYDEFHPTMKFLMCIVILLFTSSLTLKNTVKAENFVEGLI